MLELLKFQILIIKMLFESTICGDYGPNLGYFRLHVLGVFHKFSLHAQWDSTLDYMVILGSDCF